MAAVSSSLRAEVAPQSSRSAHLRIDALTLKLHTTVAPIMINFDNETTQMPEYSDGVAITVSALGKGPAVERPNLG